MSKQPFMQLYVGDYLADTLDLTTEQHGAYLLLLMCMWRNGGSLPNDPAKLARFARVHPPRWAKVWSEIERFFVLDGENLINPRLVKEHEKALLKSRSRAEAGRAGGNAKALKTNDVPVANAEAKDVPLLKHLLQKSEPEEEKEPKGSKKTPDAVLVREALTGVISADLAEQFIAHRNKLKKPMTPRAAELIAAKLLKAPNPVACVELSIVKGWQDVFPENPAVQGKPAATAGSDWWGGRDL